MFPLDVFGEPVWQRLTWTLLHFLWQGMAVAAVAAISLYVWPVRRTHNRYLIYLTALIGMAACPAVTFMVIDVPESAMVASRETAREVEVPLAPAPHPHLHPHLDRDPGPEDVATDIHIVPAKTVARESQPPLDDSETVPRVPARIDAGDSASLPAPVTPQTKARRFIDAMQPYALAVWLAGVLLLAMRLSLSWLHVRWLAWCRRVIPADLAARAATLGKRLGLRFPPRVCVSDKIREAIVVGLWRPLVLLPASWLTEMTPEVLEAVIAHELAHVRRLDLWVNLLQRLMETLLFYHPAVWWLSRHVSLQREMCADELAVDATNERLVYATALEQLGRMRLAQTVPQFGASIGGNKMVLLNRVGNILGTSSSNKRARWWPVVLLALAVPAAIWLVSMSIALPTENEAQAEETRQPDTEPLENVARAKVRAKRDEAAHSDRTAAEEAAEFPQATLVCKLKMGSIAEAEVWSPNGTRCDATCKIISPLKGDVGKEVRITFRRHANGPVMPGVDAVKAGEVFVVMLRGETEPYEMFSAMRAVDAVVEPRFGRTPGDRMLAELAAMWKSNDPGLRIRAIEQIGIMRDTRGSDQVNAAATSDDAEIARAGVIAQYRMKIAPDAKRTMELFDEQMMDVWYQESGIPQRDSDGNRILRRERGRDLIERPFMERGLPDFDYATYVRDGIKKDWVRKDDHSLYVFFGVPWKVQRKACIPELVKLLVHPDHKVRWWAVKCLEHTVDHEDRLPLEEYERYESEKSREWRTWWKEKGAAYMARHATPGAAQAEGVAGDTAIDNPLGLDDDTLIKLFRAGSVVRRVAFDCESYYRDHDRLPKDVPELATRYVERSRDSIGNDLFASGEKLRLIHDKDDQRRVQVWSVGPDGDWDGGRPIDSTKLPLDGDVGVEIRVGQSDWRWLADEPLRHSALEGKRLAHYLAARGPKLPKPELKDDGLTWGPVVDGLQLAVELSPKKDAYLLGEAIAMRFHFRNAADYAIQVGLISCRQDMSVFVHNQKGKLLKHQATWRSGTVGTRQQTLKPGETASYASSGLAFVAPGKQPGAGGVGHWVEATPGVYTVRIAQRFPIGFSSEPHEWRGELETGPVTVHIAEQPAFAIHRVKGYRKPGDRPGMTRTAYFRESGNPERFDPMRPDRYPLKDLVIDGTPLLTEADILAYNWRDHSIKLKPGVSERLYKSVEQSTMYVPFVVKAEGKTIYLGAFRPPFTSNLADLPHISLTALSPSLPKGEPLSRDAIAIENRQIPLEGRLLRDSRPDKHVKEALQKAGKLIDVRSGELPWGKAIEKVQTRLRPGEFRDGEQWLSFDLRNDSSELTVRLAPDGVGVPREILVDNIAYRWDGWVKTALPACGPAQRVTDAQFKLDKTWAPIKTVSGPETLELKPGKHTVQVIVYAAAKDFEHTGRQTRVLSNPVEIEIPPPKASAKEVPAGETRTGRAVDGDAADVSALQNVRTLADLKRCEELKVDATPWRVRVGLGDGGAEAGPWKLVYCLASYSGGGDATLSHKGQTYGQMLGPVFLDVLGDNDAERGPPSGSVVMQSTLPGRQCLFAAVVPTAWEGTYRLRIRSPAGHLLAERRLHVTDPRPCYWTEFAIKQDRAVARGEPVWAVRDNATAARPNSHGVQPLFVFDNREFANGFEQAGLPGTVPLHHEWRSLFRHKQEALKIGQTPPPLLRLSQTDGVLTIESDVRIITWADLYLLARWWVNGEPVLPPRSAGVRMISLGRAVTYGNRMQVSIALPDVLGDVEADDRVALQVLYVPGTIGQLPRNRIPGEMLKALSAAGPAASTPLLSNRLELDITP